MPEFCKWNNYTIGSIPWILNRADHPHRQVFINYALEHAQSVLEIGAGELIEYQEISKKKNIDYAIVDVSDLFIENCKTNWPDVTCYKSPMEDMDQLPFLEKSFDIVYGASVIEHSRDVRRSIANIIRMGKMFHVVMFKWSFLGNLKSHFKKKKQYYSSYFNIFNILDIFDDMASVEYCDIIDPEDGSRMNFFEYYELQKRNEFLGIWTRGDLKGRTNNNLFHRNGKYLMIHGEAK